MQGERLEVNLQGWMERLGELIAQQTSAQWRLLGVANTLSETLQDGPMAPLPASCLSVPGEAVEAETNLPVAATLGRWGQVLT